MKTDFLNELTKYITDAAAEVSRKTDEVITVQGMKSQQRLSAREIEKQYVELGKFVYSRYSAGAVIGEEAVPHCEEIKRLKEQIAKYDEEIAAYKAASSKKGEEAGEEEPEEDISEEVIDEIIKEEEIEVETKADGE